MKTRLSENRKSSTPPQSSTIYVPKNNNNTMCVEFVRRKGKLAELDRCAHCNQSRASHDDAMAFQHRVFDGAKARQRCYLLRDMITNKDVHGTFRVQILLVVALNLCRIHSKGRIYGTSLGTTSVLISNQKPRIGLRQPVPRSSKMDVFSAHHEARQRQDMLRFGHLVKQVIGTDDPTLSSLGFLSDVLVSEMPEDRPTAEAAVDWIKDVKKELGNPVRFPIIESLASTPQFRGFVHIYKPVEAGEEEDDGGESSPLARPRRNSLTTNLLYDDEDDGGYDSDGSFYPPNSLSSRDGFDQDKDDSPMRRSHSESFDAGNNGNVTDGKSKLDAFMKLMTSNNEEETANNNTPSSSSKLAAYLDLDTSNMSSRRRRDSDPLTSRSSGAGGGGGGTLDTPMAPGQSTGRRRRSFKPLSSAAKFEFRRSYHGSRERARSVRMPSPLHVAACFDRQERLPIDEACAIVQQAEIIMRQEPNILDLNEGEFQVFGDIHGQYFDLVYALRQSGYSLGDVDEVPKSGAGGGGDDDGDNEATTLLVNESTVAATSMLSGSDGDTLSTSSSNRRLLFLGDYVDRGAWSCEVFLFVLALKVARPKSVFLLRGNHETSTVVSHFGFKEEMEVKYGTTLFHRCLSCFQAMPLCAVVSSISGDKWLCLHGGLSRLLTTLDDIRQVDRFAEPGMNGLLCDLVWADPGDFAEDGDRFAPNPGRGCSVRFSKQAALQFLDNNGLKGLLRGHEVMAEGIGFQFDNRVVTVFSAPNYCGTYDNKAAYVILGGKDGLLHTAYDPAPQQPEPVMFESVSREAINSVAKTCPYMPTTLHGFVSKALQLGPAVANVIEDDIVGLPMLSLTSGGGGGAGSSFNRASSLSSDLGDDFAFLQKNIPVGATVDTPYGQGVLQNIRYEDGEPAIAVVALAYGVGYLKFMDVNNVPSSVAVVPQQQHHPSTEEYVVREAQGEDLSIQVGATVSTLFGAAIIKEIRGEDDMIVVTFTSFTGTGYLRMDSIVGNKRATAATTAVTMTSLSPSRRSSKLTRRMSSKAMIPSPMPVLAQLPVLKEETTESPRADGEMETAAMMIESPPLLVLPPSSNSTTTTTTTTRPIWEPGTLGMTPYGRGRVMEDFQTNVAMQLEFGATAYMNPNDVKVLSPVWTPYGRGHILPSSRMDGIIVVELEFGATAYLMASDVKNTPSTMMTTTASREPGSLSRNSSMRSSTGPAGTTSGGGVREHRFQTAKLADGINEAHPTITQYKIQSAEFQLRIRKLAHLESPFKVNKSKPQHMEFTDDELRNIRLLFMLLDRSDDGFIQQNEITERSQEEGETVSMEDAQKVVEAVDADHDGQIGLDDWLWFAACCKEDWLQSGVPQ